MSVITPETNTGSQQPMLNVFTLDLTPEGRGTDWDEQLQCLRC